MFVCERGVRDVFVLCVLCQPFGVVNCFHEIYCTCVNVIETKNNLGCFEYCKKLSFRILFRFFSVLCQRFPPRSLTSVPKKYFFSQPPFPEFLSVCDACAPSAARRLAAAPRNHQPFRFDHHVFDRDFSHLEDGV